MLTTSVEEVRRWFDNGLKAGAKGMIVLRNKVTLDEYPVYVRSDQGIQDQVRGYQRSYGDEVLEVYNLSHDKEQQIAENRVGLGVLAGVP